MLAALACVAAGVLSVPLFWRAHSYLDRAEPSVGPASACLGAVILLAVAATAVARPSLRGRGRLYRYALFVAIPIALVAASLGTLYDASGNVVFGLLFFLFLILVVSSLFSIVFWLLIAGIALAVHRIMRHPTSVTPAQRAARRARRFAAWFVIGWGFALAHAMAGAYILLTLPYQVEAAREAHDSPALGLLAPALVLLGLAAARQRQ